MNTTAPEVGKTYHVDHQRKGKFTLKVTAVDDTWATGTIVAGRAGAMLPYNEVETGELISVRISLARWQEAV